MIRTLVRRSIDPLESAMNAIKIFPDCLQRSIDFVPIVAMVVAALTLATNSYADLLWTFDPGENFDGWTAMEVNNPGTPFFGDVGSLAPGGDKFFHDTADPSDIEPLPNLGYLEIIDPDAATTGLLVAPMELTTVLAPGQDLLFDLKINGLEFDNDDAGPLQNLVPLFHISNAALTIIYAVPEGDINLNEWQRWDIPLGPTNGPGVDPGFWVAQDNSTGAAGIDDGTAFGLVLGGIDPLGVRIWGESTIDDPEAEAGEPALDRGKHLIDAGPLHLDGGDLVRVGAQGGRDVNAHGESRQLRTSTVSMA